MGRTIPYISKHNPQMMGVSAILPFKLLKGQTFLYYFCVEACLKHLVRISVKIVSFEKRTICSKLSTNL